MDVVSKETAIKLKNAGFPQPKFYQIGAVCYNTCGGPWASTRPAQVYDEPVVFAPTATDILEEMPYATLLYDGEYWACNFEGHETVYRDSAAEACAQCWIYNKDKENKS